MAVRGGRCLSAEIPLGLLLGALFLGASPAYALESAASPEDFDAALGADPPPDLPLSFLDLTPGETIPEDAFEGLGLIVSSAEPIVAVDDPDIGPALLLPAGTVTLVFELGQPALILAPLGPVSALDLAGFSFASPVETASLADPGPFLGLVFERPITFLSLEIPEGGLALGGLTFFGADFDLDGYGRLEGSRGGDCDDTDPAVNPGAEEIPYNGRDDDCLGGDLQDADGDGHLPLRYGGGDCDDTDPTIYPGAEELPDGRDNNCNGRIDEHTSAKDDDGDGLSEAEGDCDDGDPGTFPGAEETPYDGIDQDCDGADLTDVDGDGFDGGPGGPDCNDGVALIHPGATEVCDNRVDEDCDGVAPMCPSPTPTATEPGTPGETPTSGEGSPSAGGTGTPEVTPTEAPSPTVTQTPTPMLTEASTPSPTATATPGETATPTEPPGETATTTEPTPTPEGEGGEDSERGGCGGCGGGAWVMLLGLWRRRR